MMEVIVAILVDFLALNNLLFKLQNLFNINQACGSVESVFGQAEAPFYSRSRMPPMRSPVLIRTALCTIIALQLRPA